MQATKKGDSTKAAKARQRQQELEAENAMQYEASYAAAMARTGSSSSDEEYDEDAMEHDAAEAEYDFYLQTPNYCSSWTELLGVGCVFVGCPGTANMFTVLQ